MFLIPHMLNTWENTLVICIVSIALPPVTISLLQKEPFNNKKNIK